MSEMPPGATIIFADGWRACERGFTSRDNPYVAPHHPYPFSSLAEYQRNQWTEGFYARVNSAADRLAPKQEVEE